MISSTPLCPPASKPSATITSTFASKHFNANLLLATTCATVTPLSCKSEVYFFGFPADVNTILTFSSIIILRWSSTLGYNKGILTPKRFICSFFTLLDMFL